MNRRILKEMIGGCCVCSDERGWSENPLVYCDGVGCNVAVHQACYGIVQVPTGPWFCKKCESQERVARVKCELCPQRDGALKRTKSGGWCHVVCALYIPEAWFANVQTMEPIVLESVPTERFNKTCYICEEQKRDTKATAGACMQCNRNGCKQYFHVTCAQAQGLLCEVTSSYENVKYCGYCTYHYKKLKNLSNVKTIPAFRPIPNDGETTPDSSPEKNPPSQTTEEKTSAINNVHKDVKSPQVDQSVSSTSDSLPLTTQLPDNKAESIASENPPLVRTYSDVSDISSAFSPITEPPKSPSSENNQEPSSSVGLSAPKSQPTPTLVKMLQDGSATSSTENLFEIDVTAAPLTFEKKPADKKEERKTGTNAGSSGHPKRHRRGSIDKSSRISSKKSKSQVSSSVSTSTSGHSKEGPVKRSTGAKRSRSHSGSSSKPKASVSSSQPNLPGNHDYCGSVFGGSPYFRSLSASGTVSLSSFSAADAENSSTNYIHPPKMFPSTLKDPSEDSSQHLPLTMEQLLEQQWEQGAQFLMEQSDHFDISSLVNCLHHLKRENQQLEDKVQDLSARRNHLVAVNARLTLPLSLLDPNPSPLSSSLSVGSLEDISSPDDVQTPKFESPVPTFPKASNPNLKVEDIVSPVACTYLFSYLEADRPAASSSLLRSANGAPNTSMPFVFSDKLYHPQSLMYSVINPPPPSLCNNMPSSSVPAASSSTSSLPSSSLPSSLPSSSLPPSSLPPSSSSSSLPSSSSMPFMTTVPTNLAPNHNDNNAHFL